MTTALLDAERFNPAQTAQKLGVAETTLRFVIPIPPDLRQGNGPAFLSKDHKKRVKKPPTCQNLLVSQHVFAARLSAL